MGTDSSGLPWCERGTHDHGARLSFQLLEVSNFASFPQCFCVAAGPAKGGKYSVTTLP